MILFAKPDGHRVFAFFSPRPDKYDFESGHDMLPRAFYLSSIGASLTALLSVWIVIPGVVVQRNLPAHLSFEIVGISLLLSGVFVVFGASLLARESQHLANTDAMPQSETRAAIGSEAVAGGFLPLTLVFLSVLPPAGPTPVIRHLWILFVVGCFCVGAALAASILPFWKALQVETRKAHKAEIGKARRFGTALYVWGAILVSFVLAFLIVFGAYTVGQYNPQDVLAQQNFLASYRSLDLTNGVSPIVPVTLLFVALIVLSFVQLRRMAGYENRLPELPEMTGDPFCSKLYDIVESTKTRIHGFEGHPLYWGAFAVMVLLGLATIGRSSQTLERWPLELLIMCGALSVGFFVLLVWVRLVLAWSVFSQFLQQLERHPIRQVFSLFPRGFMWSPIWQGGGKKRTHMAITRSIECIQALWHHNRTPHGLKTAIENELKSNAPGTLTDNVQALLMASADRKTFSRLRYRELEKALARVAQKGVEYLEHHKWKQGDYELRSELARKEETKDALHTPWPEYEMEEPATICGELVAFRFLAFINFVLWQIDNLVTCVSVGFLLLVLALNSYAFRSRTIIDWILVLFFAVLTVGIIFVLAQADRDAILSRITGTEEGKLDRNFFTHVLSYGGIPTLVLLSTHFPVIGRFFFSWVKPALEAIH